MAVPAQMTEIRRLQSTIGNRAVSRVLSASRGSPVQRYTKLSVADQAATNQWQGLNADLRVSDDGRMVVKDTPTTPSGSTAFQELYATPNLIAHIGQVLGNIQSAFTVQQGNATLQGAAPKGGANRTLNKVEIEQQDFAAANNAYAQQTFTNCNLNMWNAQGLVRAQGFTAKHQFAKFNRAIGGANNNEIDLGTGNAIDLDMAKKEAAKYITGKNAWNSTTKAKYGTMKASKRDKRAMQIGANQYATPGIGEAYGIFDVGRTTEFHMAPVIAKSGNDTVTLENYAGNPGTQGGPLLFNGLTRPPTNPNWFVRMFGPVKKHTFKADEDQTFWGEHRRIEANVYGDKPLVTTLTSR